jgi:hypothetical protein
MKQVTLVSLYGQKPEALARLIGRCSDIVLRSPLAGVFKPYDIDQIHCTITGMEKLTEYPDPYNARTWMDTGEKVVMDFSQLHPVLQWHLPITVQFGGFLESFNEFESFGRSPYERSFQIQWAAKRFIMIGWSHKNGDFTSHRLLQKLRDEIENRCHIRHKYREDNDLFMVLGEIVIPDLATEKELSQLMEISSVVESEICNHLVNNKINVTIDMDSISIAQYEVETLSPASTIPHRLTGADVDERFIESLYG